jgi:hypothetical protein
MRNSILIILLIVSISFIGICSNKSYLTNGETIYRTGKNLKRQKLLDKDNSQITFIKSCQGCHGKSGSRISNCNIKWSHLTDPKILSIPYNDSLFFRFLDGDIKSDGTPAQTGVHWNMIQQDKKNLIEFLRTL